MWAGKRRFLSFHAQQEFRMPANAVAITSSGRLTDVDLGDPDLRAEHVRRLIGSVAVHPMTLASDLIMWAADPPNTELLNVVATDIVMTTANIPNRSIYGTVVCTGPFADDTITPISRDWAKRIAHHQAIRPLDDA
jgi:hypothetical protein